MASSNKKTLAVSEKGKEFLKAVELDKMSKTKTSPWKGEAARKLLGPSGRSHRQSFQVQDVKIQNERALPF